jgi:hypothetical protein
MTQGILRQTFGWIIESARQLSDGLKVSESAR